MRTAFVVFLALTLAGCAYRAPEQSSIKDTPARSPAVAQPPPPPQPPPPRGGPCDCPDDLDSLGRRCGDRSACSRKGGHVPVCPGYVCH